MDAILPIWAQPHTFWLLDDRHHQVFTFGLVLTELRSLRHPDGVRSFGGRFGYEWLPGLADGVQNETDTQMRESELQGFLRDVHGILGPNHLSLDGFDDPPKTVPPDDVLQSFAKNDGAQVAEWALNAFNGVNSSLHSWAREREPVPRGHEHAAASRLTLTAMPHRITAVMGLDGRRWGRGYESLYERVALELEDLALRRPRPRTCPLCKRVFIPLKPRQTVCANQIWDSHTRKLVRPCTPTTERGIYSAAAAADHRRRHKTRWTAMNRVRSRHGHNDPRTDTAIADWETWKKANPPPRPPGRPPQSRLDPEPPYTPDTDAQATG